MFTHSQLKKLAVTGIGASALSLTALIGAGTASASGSVDDQFLTNLANAGFDGPVQTAINLGHQVCSALDKGASENQIVSALESDQGLGAQGAHQFAVIAASSYCPQYVKST
jgi:hypothetical protein